MTGSRRWTWWHAVLLVLGLTLAAGGAFLALVYVSLIGGVDELFGGEPPREDDPRVQSAQAEAAERLDASGRALGELTRRSMQSPAQVLGGGPVGPSCQQGQHNWKIDDDYDLSCRLTQVTVVAVEDRSRFHADTAALAAALEEEWGEDTFGLGRVLDEYWEPRHGSGQVEVPAPGTDGYSMEDLPPGRYTDAGEGSHTLEVGWAEPTSPAHQVTYAVEDVDLTTPDGRPVTPAELVRLIPGGGYAVVITESVEYFRE